MIRDVRNLARYVIMTDDGETLLAQDPEPLLSSLAQKRRSYSLYSLRFHRSFIENRTEADNVETR